ncbi:MAG: hypothetical protein ACR2OO_08110 [Thermomicrobiales bacterium]
MTSTATPRPTLTASLRPTDTVVPVPTETPADSPTSEPTLTPTPEPTATPEPSATATPEPTVTATPKPSATPSPTRSPRKKPTPVPTETPAAQPTIAPAANTVPVEVVTAEATQPPVEGVTVEATQPAVETTVGIATTVEAPTPSPVETPIEPVIVTPDVTPTPIAESVASETPRIQPAATQTVGQGGPKPTPFGVEPAATGSPAAGDDALAQADVVAKLPPDVTNPPGGIRPDSTLQRFVVDSGGGLAVYDLSSGQLSPLGSGSDPVWSPGRSALLFALGPRVAVWTPAGGVATIAGDSAVDAPAGWIGDSLYFVRTFPDRPGAVEVHQADANGQNDRVFWSDKESAVTLTGRAYAANAGIRLPTADDVILIDRDGKRSDAGANPWGPVADPLVNSGGDGVAVPTGSGLFASDAATPGNTDLLSLPGGPTAGFAWSPDGKQLVVSDGSALFIFGNGGTPQGQLPAPAGGSVAVAGWSGDGVVFVLFGVDPVPTLRLVDPAAFPS